jgi:hypothetical protein
VLTVSGFSVRPLPRNGRRPEPALKVDLSTLVREKLIDPWFATVTVVDRLVKRTSFRCITASYAEIGVTVLNAAPRSRLALITSSLCFIVDETGGSSRLYALPQWLQRTTFGIAGQCDEHLIVATNLPKRRMTLDLPEEGLRLAAVSGDTGSIRVHIGKAPMGRSRLVIVTSKDYREELEFI